MNRYKEQRGDALSASFSFCMGAPRGALVLLILYAYNLKKQRKNTVGEVIL